MLAVETNSRVAGEAAIAQSTTLLALVRARGGVEEVAHVAALAVSGGGAQGAVISAGQAAPCRQVVSQVAEEALGRVALQAGRGTSPAGAIVRKIALETGGTPSSTEAGQAAVNTSAITAAAAIDIVPFNAGQAAPCRAALAGIAAPLAGGRVEPVSHCAADAAGIASAAEALPWASRAGRAARVGGVVVSHCTKQTLSPIGAELAARHRGAADRTGSG